MKYYICRDENKTVTAKIVIDDVQARAELPDGTVLGCASSYWADAIPESLEVDCSDTLEDLTPYQFRDAELGEVYLTDTEAAHEAMIAAEDADAERAEAMASSYRVLREYVS